MNNYVIIDIENNNSKQYKRNAGNFLFDKIVAICLKYSPIYGLNEQDLGRNSECISLYGEIKLQKNWFNYVNCVVGFNLKHDLLFLWKDEELQEYLKNKTNKIFDCQLAEYYLTSFQINMKEKEKISLRYLAVNKYNCSIREKKMEKYWEEGKQTSEIPKELVLEDVQNDVVDTEKMYLIQNQEASNRGLEALLEIQNNALLATTEMEYNGMKIDKENLYDAMKELDLHLILKKQKFYELIEKYVKIDDYISSPKITLHNLFFGGSIRRVRKVPEMELTGIPKLYKSGAKKHQIRMKNEEYIEIVSGLMLPCEEFTKTEKGNISIDENILTQIIERNYSNDAMQISQALLDIRGLEKQISTYYKAIYNLIYPDEMLRGKFNHCNTGTGRSSSDSPNLQNIPNKPSKVKQYFVSRY